MRSVDPLRILFYGVYYVNPREQKKTRSKNMQTKGAHINFWNIRILSARAYVYVYVTNASLSSHPDVLFVHFNDLKSDLAGEMRRIADFLGEPIKDEKLFKKLVEECTFESMKKNADAVAPLAGAVWEGGAKTFINKGTNKRWVGVLTDAQVAAYEKAAEKKLGKTCAGWLATGGKLPEEDEMNGKCVVM